MSTLYELREEYKELLAKILFEETDDEEADIERLASLEISIEEKAENTAIILKELEAESDKIKKEEVRLTTRRKQIENKMQRLKKGLEEAMVVMDKKKFKSEHFSFNVQKNAPSVFVSNEEEALKEYYKTEIKLDKQRLKDDLKNGLEVDYAHLEQTESLRIR